MAVSCEDPNALTAAAKCFCYDERTADAVIIYLLAQIAQDTSSASELALKAKCFCMPDDRSRDAVMLYLLCQISESLQAK